MVIIKNKISPTSKEVLFIASYMKVYSDFGNQRIIIEFNNGIKLYLTFKIFDVAYPNTSLHYYESYIVSTLMEFIKDLKRNIKVKMITNVKGDIANISLEVYDYSTLKRKIPLQLDLSLEMDVDILSNIHLDYDEVRDALVLKIKEENNIRTIYIGNPSSISSKEWHYEKNISILSSHSLFKHIATLTTTLDKNNPVFEVYISDDVDEYDKAHLTFSSPVPKYEILNISNTSLKKVYNYFFSYLSSAIFSNNAYELMREYYIYGKDVKNKITKKHIPSYLSVFYDDMKKEKASWMDAADENILGRSLLHTLLLANKLIDEGHYSQAYNLILSFSNSFYDIINFSLIDKLKNESRLVEMMFLFIRAFNKMFLDITIRGKSMHHVFYMPNNIEYVEFKNLNFKGIVISSLNMENYGSKIGYSIDASTTRKIKRAHIKYIGETNIIEQQFKVDDLHIFLKKWLY